MQKRCHSLATLRICLSKAPQTKYIVFEHRLTKVLGTLNTYHLQISSKSWIINSPQFPHLSAKAFEPVQSLINSTTYLLINISIKSRNYAGKRSSFSSRISYSIGERPEMVWRQKVCFFGFVFMVRTEYFSVLTGRSYRIERLGRFRRGRRKLLDMLSEKEGRWPPETRERGFIKMHKDHRFFGLKVRKLS